MEQYKNSAKIYTGSSGGELRVSMSNSPQVISATNNKAKYYSEQAKKFSELAKEYRDDALFYSQQNTNVTFEQIENVRNDLQFQIDKKQDLGDYALKSEIPVNVSELVNDSEYVYSSDFADAIDEYGLPSKVGQEGKFLMTDGQYAHWESLAALVSMFDTRISDHVLTYEETKGWGLQGTYVYKNAIAGERYGYSDFYAKCVNERDEAKANGGVQEVTLGGSSISMYIHSNGHMYYDISMKATVDNWFNTFGSAWFYGVDTENERIFLPRNKWFAISGVANNVPVAGDGKALGLMSTNSANQPYYMANVGFQSSDDEGLSMYGPQTTVANAGATYGGTRVQAQNQFVGITTDATKSGLIANTSNILNTDPDKYLYICVGNVVVDTSWVDVVTQVESGVKDLEDKTLEGLERLKASSNALTTTQISNCITEIPQRIKLELADGVLTLKAGSTVIVPNGANNFEHKSSTADISRSTFGTQSGKNIYIELVVNSTTLIPAGLSWSTNSNTTVGTTAPTSGVFYDTANNIIGNYTSGSRVDVRSFPIALVTMENGVVVSIDQVFNGFGYIGSTVFCDKGVKGLIPNGRNSDGTLNNIDFTTDKVLIEESFNNNNNLVQARIELYNGNLRIIRNTVSSSFGFDYENNIYYRDDGQHKNSTLLATVKTSSTGIEDFNPEYAFKALGFSDKSEISGWAMPSKRNLSLTVGTSGSMYTAPANGWFYFAGVSTAANQFYTMWILNNDVAVAKTQAYSSATSQYLGNTLPVAKGSKLKLDYSLGGDKWVYFVYAEGEI